MQIVKMREYFVMDLNYSDQGMVKVPMIRYLKSVLQEIQEHQGVTRATQAADYLFKVCNER